MSGSPTITDDVWSDDPRDWLHNPHAGEMLQSEFLDPLNLSATDIAGLIDLPTDRVLEVIEGRQAMDAELDLRLGRYFRMGEGFFLRLQASYELLEAKRALGSQIDRIVPRAA